MKTKIRNNNIKKLSIIIVFIFMFVMLLGASSNETYETKVDVKYASTRQMGDMDGDGKIALRDVTDLYRYVKGNKTIIDSEAIKVADLSGDGEITVADVSLLYRKLKSITNDDSGSKDDNKDDNKKDDTSTLNCSSTPKSFETDSWDTIICAAKSGNTSVYRIGDEREIDMGSFGKHKVRLANKSTDDYCENENYSKSACGFVIEFTDIITQHAMDREYSFAEQKKEGWSVSSMRTYINSEIYNALPSNIRKNVIDTRIISNLEINYGADNPSSSIVATNDKMYLLSFKDIYYSNALDFYDKYLGKTYQNYNVLIKKTTNASEDEHEYWWWVRDGDHGYGCISTNDKGYTNGCGPASSSAMRGVSPAFRLGE